MEIFLHSEAWIALLTLTLLEVILGIDNIIFISILSNKLPKNKQKSGRRTGLILAFATRILMLLSITWIVGFEKPLFEIFHHPVSGRDIILLIGGMFLIAKSVTEIGHKMEGPIKNVTEKKRNSSFISVITQIALLDIVFSFDSILTAIGLSREILIMILAIVISMIVMLIFVNSISRFIDKHPSLQILALSFLILIGFMLVLESFHLEIPKGYIYSAVFFSLIVEFINIRIRRKSQPVKLHDKIPRS